MLATAVTAQATIEKPLDNSKLEEAFYKCVKDYTKVQTFRKLKAEGNFGSATALATLVVIDQTLYPLLEQEHEMKMVIDEANGPDINDHPEMLK